jgi:hypothetical protein
VVWCVSEGGKKLPVDEASCPDGNLVLAFNNPDGSEPVARPYRKADHHVEPPRHKCHLATCVDRREVGEEAP